MNTTTTIENTKAATLRKTAEMHASIGHHGTAAFYRMLASSHDPQNSECWRRDFAMKARRSALDLLDDIDRKLDMARQRLDTLWAAKAADLKYSEICRVGDEIERLRIAKNEIRAAL